MATTNERYYDAINNELMGIKDNYGYKNLSVAFVHYFLSITII